MRNPKSCRVNNGYFMWRGRVSEEDILVEEILLMSSSWEGT
jgi:hypothetical protein